jgi:hypothetical protein
MPTQEPKPLSFTLNSESNETASLTTAKIDRDKYRRVKTKLTAAAAFAPAKVFQKLKTEPKKDV